MIRALLRPVDLHVLRDLEGDAIYDPGNYVEAQRLGYALRGTGSYGVHYRRVRADGECFGVMRPRALSDAVHWRYLRFYYQQGKIIDVEQLDDSDRR